MAAFIHPFPPRPARPLVALVLQQVSSAAGRELDWAGRRYRLLGFARVAIVPPR